ncbi:hypothetical protein H072_11404 [Dactylellina haptotyla CBS 200.50]|uniref:Uncharacterized protein n=1 Tax=Dactylellina haptotyla (strain CBS 200.50) TaxID=1284197 RepID=S8BIM7_DACHA|nr:hypothetical protein H072_11404 [Dactylellina haptotyla CBS 200.50]
MLETLFISAALSVETRGALATPLSVLCFLFFYLSLGTFFLASVETILGIVKKDDQSAGWWRRSRLVALTYAQMYLSQHFLRTLTSGKTGVDLPEKTFWMASQTIAAGVVLFSSVGTQATAERLLIGKCYNFEKPQAAQVILTAVVSFNTFLLGGPLAAFLAAITLLVGLDWKILGLMFEGIATWKVSQGNIRAEFAWNILHIALAIGLMRAVHNLDNQEGLIALPTDEEKALPAEESEIKSDEGADNENTDQSEDSISLPAGRLFLMFTILIVLASAIIMTVFFGLEKLFFPEIHASRDDLNAEALVLSHMFTMEAVGILLVSILTVREICGNSMIKQIIDCLC